ncbi:MAG: alpha-1,4-glucan--maltose-1-phosphate maltosyltransferase [Candidatus Nanopelagicales bacterium]
MPAAKRSPDAGAAARKPPAKKAPATKAAPRRPARTAAATPPAAVPQVLTGRFPVTDVRPTVESGRLPAKAVVGEVVPITVTAFREGHDSLGVDAVLVRPDGREHQRVRMADIGSGVDEWTALVSPDAEGDWSFRIESWGDPWGTWSHRAGLKVPAGVDIDIELAEGIHLLKRLSSTLPASAAEARTAIDSAINAMRNDRLPPVVRYSASQDAALRTIALDYPLRDSVTTCGPWPLRVERRRALVGAWYEFFPRSEGATAKKHGTFASAAKRLPAIAAMGFDVVYLPPIHPIGRTHRKGRNNALGAKASDPGSPWAIGSDTGGHDAVHPDLGTERDFGDFVRATHDLGMEVALDLALQASPDHPWVAAHPEWFTTRADGSIAFAENPPKKYQDIYPVNFDNDPEGIYAEVVRIVRHWMARDVRIFRVDNPHTKPLWLWQRLIAEINATDPDVIFLAEAFTRPPMMRALAESGFQQSYTYFTWRNDKRGLEDYFRELAGPAAAYMRPNVFVNTPDILTEYLQTGGPAAFAIRATVAATLSPTWGVYSGFELYERVAVREGSEEYVDSEKFELKPRNWAGAQKSGRTLAPYITQLNRLRRELAPLQDLRSLRFHHTEDDQVIAYSKAVGDDIVLVVCTLDPHQVRETTVWWDMPSLGMDWPDRFVARDRISGQDWTWGQATYVRFDPSVTVAHVVEVQTP